MIEQTFLNQVQIIYQNGKPLMAVLPHQEWQKVAAYVLALSNQNLNIPPAVLLRVLRHRITPMRAWRDHLQLSQLQIAERMGITQPAYSQLERRGSPTSSSIEAFATAIGVEPHQINW